MRKCLIIFALLFSVLAAYAQSPTAIPYQALVRNASGTLLANQSVKLRFSIRDSIAAGGILYRELHTLNTNAQGLVSVNIGTGSALSGNFTGINWGRNAKFLQAELDAQNNNVYTDLGTTQMMSVPYALHASNGLTNGTATNQILYWNGNNWVTLSPGTQGQVLTICNGAMTWTSGGQCPGNITSLNCSGSTNSGILTAGIAANGVSSVVSYTGGNGGAFSGQTVSSTGVTGLTATLAAGTFANGVGSLSYLISGTPASSGTASFALSIGGQNCILTRQVTSASPSVTSLYCSLSSTIGSIIQGQPTSALRSVPYAGGNGGQYEAQTLTSSGVVGLIASLSAGTLANGSGTLVYSISGTALTSGVASFALNMGGQNCTLNITVQPNQPPAVGHSRLGGIVAYILRPGDIGYDSTVVHGLIASPSDIGSAFWGNMTDIPGASGTAIGTGLQNTIDIITWDQQQGTAAWVCAELVLNGYDDWYLPSVSELLKFYENRGFIGGFQNTNYWTSTECTSNYSTRIGVNDGWGSSCFGKGAQLVIRPIRYF